MLQDSYATADVDMKLRALREEQVEAERILLATQSALDADGDLLSDTERSTLIALMDSLRSKMQTEDHLVIKEAVDELAHGTEEFAARRMDRSVRAALSGKKLDQIV
jgi:molecular chaperone HscA